MSYASFCLEKNHTARKNHYCNACNTLIEPGENYLSVTGKWPENDGIARFAYHPDCRTTENTLNIELLDYGENYATLSELLSDSPHDVIPLLPEAVAKRFSHQIQRISEKMPNFCPPDILLIIRAAQEKHLALTAMQIRIMRHIASHDGLTIEQISQNLKLHSLIKHPISRLFAKGLIEKNKNGEVSIKTEGARYIHAAHPAH